MIIKVKSLWYIETDEKHIYDITCGTALMLQVWKKTISVVGWLNLN